MPGQSEWTIQFDATDAASMSLREADLRSTALRKAEPTGRSFQFVVPRRPAMGHRWRDETNKGSRGETLVFVFLLDFLLDQPPCESGLLLGCRRGLKMTAASGGRMIFMDAGSPCQGIGSEAACPPLPTFPPP